MFIVYTDGNETLITIKKHEKVFLKMYFGKDQRNIEDYEREEFNDKGLIITADVRVF